MGLLTEHIDHTLPRTVEVEADSGRKPRTVARLRDWEYLERSIMRLIAGWGRYAAEWQDKVVVHRQIWEQAECVRRLRDRLTQFPGSVHNLDQPVSARLEKLANTVLLAPTHQDAVDGIYQILTGALTLAYLTYIQQAHPVHDAPTVAMLHEIVAIKEQQRLWLRDYRRRYPHSRFARRRPPSAAMVSDTVLLPIGIVGVARTEGVDEVAVIPAALVLISDQQGDRSPGGFPLEHPG